MPSFDIIIAGINDTLTVFNIIMILAGVLTGLVVGVIPGLNGPMAMAIAIPVTFYLEPVAGIGYLLGIMKGGTIGGAVPAILLNTPGTPDAAITALDGYPMAKNGQSGKALKIAMYSSISGDTISDIVLISVAIPLGALAMLMGPVEQASVVFFSICIIAGLLGSSPLRGFLSATTGFMLATVGQFPEEGTPRLTFGFTELEAGIPLVGIGMGVLVVGEVFYAVTHRGSNAGRLIVPEATVEGSTLRFSEYWACRFTILRSAGIGTFIGAVPGIGSALAATIGYASTKKISDNPDNFGKGEIRGVAAAEAANSAVSGANLIPLLTLGIPGSLTAAFLMGALIVHGVIPGPSLMSDEPRLIYALFTAMIIANIGNLVIGRFGLRHFAKLATIPATIVYPTVILLCMAGAYISGNGEIGLIMLAVFGVVGYVMRILGLPIIIFIIAFILGRMWEIPLSQALILTEGKLLNLLNYPIAAAFFSLGILTVLYSSWSYVRRK